MTAYRFIDKYQKLFGLRWLLRRLNICPNAYYNYKKHRKEKYESWRQNVKDKILQIYHQHKGIPGYRQMQVYLKNEGFNLSALTVLKYMSELGIRSITRRKRPEYKQGKAHKVFPNLLEQDFSCDEINTKWCTDFTYLFLKDGSKRYNCSILDLHDRSIVASITDKKITADLAVRTLRKAIDSQPPIKGVLILHSDQGSQYTSKEFVEYCERMAVTQSMSKAGYPYDNAPMERYFNTLKCDHIYQHEYATEESLYKAVEEYAYVTYNRVRPHSYNNYMTPYEARYAV